MRLSVLASGSSGNCFYIENNKAGILVDAGISARRIGERLASLKINPRKIKGIFITHEHQDHVKGADVLARNFQIPVFATKKTAEGCFLCSQEDLIQTIKNNETINIGSMDVEAFSKSHKAFDPVSYSISNEKKISIITDLGKACGNVIDSVADSDFLCLESNHDIRMLEQGSYPYFLKEWIKSDFGHLSNMQAALLVLEHGKSRLKNIILSHISRNNNTPELALKSFSLIKERYDLHPKILAPRHGEMTGFFRI